MRRLSRLGWLRLGIGAAYGGAILSIVAGWAPIWCLGVLLTLPTAFRALRSAVNVTASAVNITASAVNVTAMADAAVVPRRCKPPLVFSEAVRGWVLAFCGQWLVGCVIARIAR